MVPKEITSQILFTCNALGQLIAKAKQYWEKGYSITSLSYGDGSLGNVFIVVMSKVPGWGKQEIHCGQTLPIKDIQISMALGRSITNVMNDTFEWSVVMTSVPEVAPKLFEGSNQSWVTSCKEADLLSKINDVCKDDVVLTKVSSKVAPCLRSAIAVTTRYKNFSISQTRRFMKDKLVIQDVESMCVHGKYVVDICELLNGALVVADNSTGWGKCKVIKASDPQDFRDKIEKYWGRGYFVTTITSYNYEWVAVLGKK